MAELKQCDYCKVKPEGSIFLVPRMWHDKRYWQVTCYNCGARGPFKKEHIDAIDAWNKRS